MAEPRWRRWLARYGMAEIAGTIGSYAGWYLATTLGAPAALASYAAAAGENCGFYGSVAARDLNVERARAARVFRNLLHEFGAAEVIDFAFTRPGATWLATTWLGPAIGILAGKLAADLIFYTLAILAHERMRRAP